jgi:O-antigen/teichoic acid export membrane protein
VASQAIGRFLPQEAATVVVVGGIVMYFAFAQANAWLTGVIAGRRAFAKLNLASLLVAGLGAGFSVLLLVTRWITSPWALIGLLILLEVCRTIALGSAVRSLPRTDGLAPDTPTQPSAWDLARYSGLSFVADSLQYVSYRFDMWVVDGYHGAAELGRYALAVSLAELVWILPTAVSRVIFPVASQLADEHGAKLAVRSATAAVLTSALIGLAGWAGSVLVLVPIFGPEFSDVPTLIGILLIGVIPFAAAKVLGSYLSAIGAMAWNTLSTVVILGISVSLCFVLIPSGGATGAAVATAITYFIHTAVLGWLFLRRTGMSSSTLVSVILRGDARPAS